MNNTSEFQPPVANEMQIQRNKLLSRYDSSRGNLLIVMLFSLINLIILAVGGNSYFLFSASVPYAIGDMAMYLCGKYPQEFYTAEELSAGEFLNNTVFVIMLAAAFICIAFYFLCWLMSKKHGVGWLIAALAAFVLDTLFMFWWYVSFADIVLDIVIHIWVLVSLIMGIIAYFKLKKIPVEEAAAVEEPVAQTVLNGGEDNEL